MASVSWSMIFQLIKAPLFINCQVAQWWAQSEVISEIFTLTFNIFRAQRGAALYFELLIMTLLPVPIYIQLVIQIESNHAFFAKSEC